MLKKVIELVLRAKLWEEFHHLPQKLCKRRESVPGWTPGSASSDLQVQYIIFETRIEILTLTNLYLDKYEGILSMTFKSVPGWPAGSASRDLQLKYIIQVYYF